MISHARKVCLDQALKLNLVAKLKQQGEIVRFADEPALAALCTCIGLEFELGQKDFDRLSPFFGVDVSLAQTNPWRRDIITNGNELGIQISRLDGKPLEIRHPEFANILAPESFDASGALNQIIIFPGRVAKTYQARGFDLVIVRDWLLNSSLCLNPDDRVPYLFANEWEIRNNIAATQVKLMQVNQLAFSGTHDVVDHLLNANSDRFGQFKSLFGKAGRTYDGVFKRGQPSTDSQLVLSYLVGVLLDDLAQPRWYGSQKHEFLTRAALGVLPKATKTRNSLALPKSFHSLVNELRSPELNLPRLGQHFTHFVNHL